MRKLVICTTGTSIANGCPNFREMAQNPIDWDSDSSLVRELKLQIKEKLAAIDLKNTTARRNTSAEINTLDHVGISNRDMIVLITTDSAFNRICAETIRKIIIEQYHLNENDVILRRIEGLQVHNAKTLREQGLKNFVKVILEYVSNDEYTNSYDIILNPTGGYKGIVPFLTILGMLYGKRTVYMFEFSEELINLPPLPFSFDLEIYDRVKHALAYIESEVAVTEQAFLSKVIGYSPQERDLFMAFTEPIDNNMITLSPLAYCLISVDADKETAMISKKALKQLNAVQGVSGICLKRMVSSSGNPLWRHQHFHPFEGTDLMIMKTGRTAERIAGFMKDGKYHITLVFDNHDEYERDCSKYNKKDFARDEFVEWTPDDNYGSDDDPPEKLFKDRDQLLLEKSVLARKKDELAQKLDAKELEVLELQEKLDKVKSDIQTMEKSFNKQIDQKVGEIRQLTERSEIFEIQNQGEQDEPKAPVLTNNVTQHTHVGLFQYIKSFFWRKR